MNIKKYRKFININTNQIYMKCFQFNWVAWSNLYLGKVPLIAIANIQINNVLNINEI